MINNKTVILGIDNTLWDFAEVLYEKLCKFNRALPTPDCWNCLDFCKNYIPQKCFYLAIDTIHMNQHIYGVFPDAKKFLQEIKKLGYYIIIATHRIQITKIPTFRWLNKHGVIFDRLHLCHDKTIFFDYCSIAIDDAPDVLEQAKKCGLIVTGLEFAWNRGKGFRLFSTLTEIWSQFICQIYNLS